MRKLLLTCSLAILCVPNLIWAHESIAIIVNKTIALEDLPSGDLARIYRGETDHWPDGQQIFVVNRHFQSKIREQFYNLVLNSEPTKKFFKPGSPLPFKTMVAKSPLSAVNFVARIPNAISYVYLSQVSKKVKALRVDGKLPTENGYALVANQDISKEVLMLVERVTEMINGNSFKYKYLRNSLWNQFNLKTSLTMKYGLNEP